MESIDKKYKRTVYYGVSAAKRTVDDLAIN